MKGVTRPSASRAGGQRFSHGGGVSVGAGLIENDAEAGYFAVAKAKVTRHLEVFGQVGLVVGPVVSCAHNGFVVVVQDFPYIHGHVVAHELLGQKDPDGLGAPYFASVVVDVGVGGEGGNDPVEVEGIDGVDVFCDNAGLLNGVRHG